MTTFLGKAVRQWHPPPLHPTWSLRSPEHWLTIVNHDGRFVWMLTPLRNVLCPGLGYGSGASVRECEIEASRVANR